jgi:hypothetical protein
VTVRGYPSQSASAPLVDIVTPATSVSFLRPELDDFLHAPIGLERNEMPLSVLSALARLGLDPWKEATELSQLSSNTATQRLAALIMRLPQGRWTQADSRGIAHRLIELLPRRSSPTVPLMEKAPSIPRMTASPAAKMLICAVLVGIALIGAASCEPASGADVAASRTTEATETVPVLSEAGPRLFCTASYGARQLAPPWWSPRDASRPTPQSSSHSSWTRCAPRCSVRRA